MRFVCVALFSLSLLLVGCSSTGHFKHSNDTRVDLSRNNYKIIRSNAIGRSSGFSLLGILPIVPPTYNSAMADLHGAGGLQEGQAQALANVTQERSTLYLVLFSIPRITIRADIVEFTE